MFGEAFKRKFALTDQGVANVKKGTFWTVIVNFIDFAGIGILFMLMKQLMATLLGGKTVLVIAHRMRTVENADKIVVLADGKVAEEGSPAELRAKEGGLFRHMSKLQQQSSGWAL